MDPGATYITGKPKPGPGSLYGLDSTFVGFVMVGFHAMMGTPDGVLNHTQSSITEHRYWYNGVESGELAQNSAIAGYFNVPLIMVTGDVATCREAHTFFGNNLVTEAVKKGVSRESAILYPFEQTRKALYEGAKRAMLSIPKCKPFKPQYPLQVKVQWQDADKSVKTKEGIANDGLHILNF
jgi:D-amino peptidase